MTSASRASGLIGLAIASALLIGGCPQGGGLFGVNLDGWWNVEIRGENQQTGETETADAGDIQISGDSIAKITNPDGSEIELNGGAVTENGVTVTRRGWVERSGDSVTLVIEQTIESDADPNQPTTTARTEYRGTIVDNNNIETDLWATDADGELQQAEGITYRFWRG